MSSASRLRSLAPPPPNRPLPPIPTAEEEKAAAASQRRSSSTIVTLGNTMKFYYSSASTTTHKRPQLLSESKAINQTAQRRSPSMLTATINAQILSHPSPLIQQFSTPLKLITFQAQLNRRPVPKMGTKSHPRGAQVSGGIPGIAIESNNKICHLPPQTPESPPQSSSSSSSGCEDSTIDSHRISEDYMKITSQPCLPDHQNQDSDDGYTSLNALDNQKQKNQKCLTKKKSLTSNSRRPQSISSSVTSSASFDDESTLVCTNYGSKTIDVHPSDGMMYRLKIKSTASAINSATQFHGNKRLVRKYRAKRRELGVAESALPKTASLDRGHGKRNTSNNINQQNMKDKVKQKTRESPCRLITMLVV